MRQWIYFEKLEDAMSEFLKQYASWKGQVSLIHGGGIDQIYGGGSWAVVLQDPGDWPSKGDVFIAHIREHLDKIDMVDAPVICKICDKDVDTIYQEFQKRKE